MAIDSEKALVENRSLSAFAKFLAGATGILIVLGGLVTSTASGLSVPDWPTSFGYSMFTLPWHRWMEEGVRFEHTHRVYASFIGLLTIILCVWMLLREPRRWLRILGIAALVLVCAQGVLGGITVRYKLPMPVSVAHACMAQVFFALTVAIATFLSPAWQAEQERPGSRNLTRVHRLSVVTLGFIFLQLVLGAVMRHTEGAGLAISTFPLAYGHLIPPGLDIFTVQIHFAHRIGALLVAFHALLLVARVARTCRAEPRILWPAGLLLLLVATQIALGAATVLTGKAVTPTTAHVVCGALILVTTLTIALRSRRAIGDRSTANADAAGISERGAMRAPATPSRAADYASLTKPRITALVVLTAFVGFFLGARGPIDVDLLFRALLGTALVASGASTLNQWAERAYDRDMRRTARRALPSGRLLPVEALLFGVALALAGTAILWTVNPLTAGLGALTLGLYVLVYTPLKRVTWLCTLVGAVPGALPPVMGWAAARGDVSLEAWALFAILFIWQLPHFYAIAWIFKDDYARAGYVMLTVDDPEGTRTARQIAAMSAVLVPVSLAPWFLGAAGNVYLAGALLLGLAHLALGLGVWAYRTRPSARAVFLGSIVYLPLLLVLLTMDRA